MVVLKICKHIILIATSTLQKSFISCLQNLHVGIAMGGWRGVKDRSLGQHDGAIAANHQALTTGWE